MNIKPENNLPLNKNYIDALFKHIIIFKKVQKPADTESQEKSSTYFPMPSSLRDHQLIIVDGFSCFCIKETELVNHLSKLN